MLLVKKISNLAAKLGFVKFCHKIRQIEVNSATTQTFTNILPFV